MAARGAGAAARADAPHRRTFAAWAAHRRGDSMRDWNRRGVIGLVGGAAAWPFAARAQPHALPVIGLLSSRSPVTDAPFIAAVRRGLSELGFAEGHHFETNYRWADGQYDRLPGLAADLVRRRVAVIVTMGGESSALAAKLAT